MSRCKKPRLSSGRQARINVRMERERRAMMTGNKEVDAFIAEVEEA